MDLVLVGDEGDGGVEGGVSKFEICVVLKEAMSTSSSMSLYISSASEFPLTRDEG